MKALSLQSLFIAVACLTNSCNKQDYTNILPVINQTPSDIAVKWADMSLYTIRFSSFNSPTYASRSLAYLGLTMYESIVNGDSMKQSLSGQLNGFTAPLPEPGKPYHWLLAFNAATDTILKLLYPVPDNSHIYVHNRIDSLYNAVYNEQRKGIHPDIVNRSVAFGRSIALSVYQWSLRDGGDKGFSRNFDPAYVFPSGASYWKPPVGGQISSSFPLHPYWGSNRTFAIKNSSIPVPPIVPFSSDTSTAYFKMYKEVYDKDPLLTQDEKEIAAWWGDDPTETFSPPGHSFYIATIAIKQSKANLGKATEAYARTGLAIADAFINCWKAKTTYFNERPSSFVNTYINNAWIPFWPEPPFPAFPSGHSTQGAAMATVLSKIFGEAFSFTDDAHLGHRRYDRPRFYDLVYPARSYSSFWEAARECGYSRILGGIHTRQDNDTGLMIGQQVGDNINALNWAK